MKILIVEDERNISDRLKALLETCAAVDEVVIAETLAEGIAKSQEIQPDITLLDLLLPDANDWSVTVAAIPRFLPPVIVVTELDDRSAEMAAFEAGAEDVIRKSTALKIASLLIAAIASAQMRRLSRDKRNGQ